MKFKFQCPSSFIKHIHTPLFTYCPWQLLYHNGRACNGDSTAPQSLKYWPSVALESLLTLLWDKEDLTPANKSLPARVCCSYSAEELKKNSQEVILKVTEDRETWKGWGKSCYTFKLLLFNRAHFQPILSPVALPLNMMKSTTGI